MRLLRRITAVGVSLMAAVALLAPASYTNAQIARDCDDNAIIKCGVGSLDELKQKYRENQAGNVTTIFQHFGIGSEGVMDGMVSGRVTRSNEVFVGDNLVATNAITAGRQSMPGSTPILGGIAYERPPSVSFNASSLPALVKIEAGQFKFAVIMSCGNPVKATPKPPEQPVTPPSVSIRKDVRAAGQTEWQDSVGLENNRLAEFRIVVKNTGKVAINNFVVGDKLPEGMTIEANSLMVNGQANTSSAFTSNGITINQALQPGAELTITFKASLAPSQSVSQTHAAQTADTNVPDKLKRTDKRVSSSDQECRTDRYRNEAFVKVPNLPEKEDDATVTTETCEERPPKTTTPVTPVGTPPETTPPVAPQPAPAPPLPATGPASIMGIVSVTTVLGAVVHKLKDFYLVILNK